MSDKILPHVILKTLPIPKRKKLIYTPFCQAVWKMVNKKYGGIFS